MSILCTKRLIAFKAYTHQSTDSNYSKNKNIKLLPCAADCGVFAFELKFQNSEKSSERDSSGFISTMLSRLYFFFLMSPFVRIFR